MDSSRMGAFAGPGHSTPGPLLPFHHILDGEGEDSGGVGAHLVPPYGVVGDSILVQRGETMRLQTSLTSRWVGNESMCWWKWVIVFVFALLLISSCDGRSLSDIDLEPLLIQPGDLPNELTAGSVKVIEPDPDVFRHDQALEQEIVTRNGDLAGVVRVYLFRSKADRDNAYDLFSLVESQEGIVPYSVPPIGDFTSARHTDKGGLEVVFVRCHAVTVIWLRTAGDYVLKNDHVVQYAQQIDHRLASAVCP